MIPHYYSSDPFALADANRAAAEATNRAERATRELKEVSARFERLVLLSEALWALMKTRTDLTEHDLIQQMSAIELQKNQTTKLDCPQCHHPMSARRRKCMYCGHAEPVKNLFQAV